MLESVTPAFFDHGIVCQAVVDLPAWLEDLSGKSGWRLERDEEGELCDSYAFRRGEEEIQVVIYHTGYATVEKGEAVLYDGHLSTAVGHAQLQYFNAENGERVLLN
jgi:hypothetical protein